MLKNYANEHPKNKKKNQDSNVKVAKTFYSRGKKYTSTSFKKLSETERKNIIDDMSWDRLQKIYDKLGIK